MIKRARAAAQAAEAEAWAAAEQGAERVRRMFPAWAVCAQACADTPHWTLLRKAVDWRADLIVVGSHGRSALARVLLGSVSQQVLHHAPCSVRIARGATSAATGPAGRGDRPVRLVLGVDGSVDSATAASAVGARAWPAGTEVLVVGVLDWYTLLGSLEFAHTGNTDDEATDHVLPRLARCVEAVGNDLRRSGLLATTRLTAGDPKRVLLHEAERVGADCVFLGARGHSRLERILIGSVSASVAARAHCSVEVVRHG
jgi:nucleotide-binding universal stress UspA family protein